MYCTGFNFHNKSLTRTHPWCGGACLDGRPPICACSVALSLLVQVVVHCGALSTVIWLSHLLCCNADPLFFCGWSSNVEWTSNRSKHLPNGACSQFHHLLKTVLFRLAWVGSASEKGS